MKSQFFRICVLSSSVLATACGTTNHGAPVVEHPAAATPSEATKPVPPVAKPTPKPTVERGYYAVQKGDTLIRIALEFGQNYRDLITWNNLSDPNDIKVDQVLRVLPPEAGTAPAAGQAQTASVVPPAAEVKPLATPVPNKTGPKGDKRVYSETTLAELQKPDSGLAPIAPAPASVPEKAVTGKPAETLATNPDEEPISWTWPTDGKLVSPFDETRKGIDIAGKAGQPVVVAASGKVMYAGNGIRGYGNLVIVKHSSNIVSAYANNNAILVKEGQTVTKGQKIAEMGSTDADSVELHFEIRQQGKPVDPTKLLPNR
jgi:lipoprotein NlpD